MNAFTTKPKIDGAWLKKLKHSAQATKAGQYRAIHQGGQVAVGMGSRDLEKTRVHLRPTQSTNKRGEH